jgi:putative transposase
MSKRGLRFGTRASESGPSPNALIEKLMSIKSLHNSDYSLHFVTFTCFQWINLFEITNGYEFVYKWFEYLKKKQINVMGYVIMPNHVHLILHLTDPTMNLNKIIGNGKRFLAYAIIQVLEREGRLDILDVLYYNVTARERNKGQRYRVFEKSFDAKPIYTEYFLNQKIDYIHHNPVRGKWRLVNDYTMYQHSSASFYETGKSCFFQPFHFNEL